MRRIAALLLLLLSCESDTPQAETIRTVGGSNPDYATIQACADNAPLPTAGNPTVCLVRPGTYNGGVDVDRGGADSTGRFIFRAENPAVSCPDVDNDPFDCTTNTTNRSIVDGDGAAGFDVNSDYVAIEGFEITDTRGAAGIDIRGSGYSNRIKDIVIQFVHIRDNGDFYSILTFYVDGLLIDHTYWSESGAGSGSHTTSYGFQCREGSTNISLSHVHWSGGYSHGISIKRDCDNVKISYAICEDAESECINIGQNVDDDTVINGGTSCSGQPHSGGRLIPLNLV